jgi:hypothetical protein
MPWTFDFWMKTLQDPGIFWAMLTAITTVALAAVAYWQLSDLAQTNRSDFIYKLKEDFFTDEARRLVFLVDNDLLQFKVATIPYFEIAIPEDAETRKRIEELGIVGSTLSTYLVDDVLLGPLEDVGVLLKLGRISLRETYEHFDSYVQNCANDNAIQDYLSWSREGEDNEDVYDNFQELSERLEIEGPKIRARKLKKRAAPVSR